MLNQVLEEVPVGRLRQHEENPRRGNVDVIVESIKANGWYGTIVAQRSTGRIVAGNHRWLAAKSLGMTTVPVMWVDVTDEQAKRILLVDNRANDVAGYDTQQLVVMLEAMLQEGDGLLGTGYSADDLDDLLAELDRVAETERQPFQGGYAATDEEIDAELGNGSRVGRAAAGLREVVLVLAEADYPEFVGLVGKAKAAWNLDNTTAACMEALRKASL